MIKLKDRALEFDVLYSITKSLKNQMEILFERYPKELPSDSLIIILAGGQDVITIQNTG